MADPFDPTDAIARSTPFGDNAPPGFDPTNILVANPLAGNLMPPTPPNVIVPQQNNDAGMVAVPGAQARAQAAAPQPVQRQHFQPHFNHPPQQPFNPFPYIGYGNQGSYRLQAIHPFVQVPHAAMPAAPAGPPGATGVQGQSLADKYAGAYASAKQANLDRYNQLLAGYTGLAGRAMHDFNSAGNSAAAGINQHFNDIDANERQRLVSEGLANSSIIPSMATSGARMQALGQLNDQRAMQRAGLDEKLTGSILHLIESRSDPYPSQPEFLQAMANLGRYGGGAGIPAPLRAPQPMTGSDHYGGGRGEFPRSMRPDLLHEGQHGRSPPGNMSYGGYGQAVLQAARQRGLGETQIGQYMGPWQ